MVRISFVIGDLPVRFWGYYSTSGPKRKTALWVRVALLGGVKRRFCIMALELIEC
jgi:hypothetical protein